MSEAVVRKVIKTIPATRDRYTATPIKAETKRRVAAYARVSTDDEEQQTSYEHQVTHYTQYIQEHEGWLFAGMFTDEGITGTSTKHRDGFNAMINAAMAGKIDLILTKSVSRFARNTVDTLTTVRKLKAIGVEVYFEKENIFTLDSKGELLITIMSSLAQEESRSISENVTWGMRKRFAEGKPIIPYGAFLGYRKGPDGMPEIDPEQAETVRYIYRAFLEGKAPSYIARDLTARGILTPGGKTTWRANTVMSILTNEKYKGDALLQKTFCTDFLTKAYKVNEGEVPQYYVEHSHPAIIDRAMFDAVQTEIKRRAEPGQRTYTPYTLSGKIYCAECGARYGSKMRRGKQSWRCNNRHLGRTKCTAPVLHTETIEDAFVTAFNQVIERKDEIIRICMDTMTERCDVSGIDARLATLSAELDVVAELIAQNIATNARVALDQDENRQKFEELMARHDSIQNEIHELERQRAELIAKLNGIRHYIGVIQDEGRITGFDETLWLNTVDRLWIKPDGTMRFEFKGGPAIEG